MVPPVASGNVKSGVATSPTGGLINVFVGTVGCVDPLGAESEDPQAVATTRITIAERKMPRRMQPL